MRLASAATLPTMTAESTIVVSSPADLIAITPYLFGFHPADSLVVIGLTGRRVEFGARSDLPPPGLDDAAEVAAVIAAQSIESIAVLGYGAAATVLPAIDRLTIALAQRQLSIVSAIRVDQGRWWCCNCAHPDRCPAQGVEFAAASSAVAAAAVYQGHVALPDRHALVDLVAPVVGEARAAMTAATKRAQARWANLPNRSVLRAGRAAVRAAEKRYRGGHRLTDDEIAWLGLLLRVPAVTDYAMDRCELEAGQVELWTDVLRRVEPVSVPAVGCLLGFAAWRCGQGVLARVAVDRALQQDPFHQLATLLDELLSRGIGPDAALNFSPRDR